jgi:hypothetical protein
VATQPEFSTLNLPVCTDFPDVPIVKRGELILSPEEKFGPGYARLMCKSLPTLIQHNTNAEILCATAAVARNILHRPIAVSRLDQRAWYKIP